VQVSATAGGNTASAAAAESQALPNTGLSLVGIVAVGGALVAAGVVLRRREQRKN
jgi:LPXTG-motif cell wall-anchored protein